MTFQAAMYREALQAAADGAWLTEVDSVLAAQAFDMIKRADDMTKRADAWRDAPVWMIWNWGRMQLRPDYRAAARLALGETEAPAAGSAQRR